MRNTSDLLITMAALFGRIVGAVRAADRKWFSGLENRIKFSCRSLAPPTQAQFSFPALAQSNKETSKALLIVVASVRKRKRRRN